MKPITKSPISREALAKLKETHLMKDPQDISILTGLQGELTAQLNKTPGADNNLIGMAFQAAGLAIDLLRNTMSLAMWQRAAYEADKQSKLLLHDPQAVAAAKGLWEAVKYMQAAHLNSIAWLEVVLDREEAAAKEKEVSQ